MARRPKADKRTSILAAAAKLFAKRPFHEVLLDDVAAAARVGKGTVYLYFKGKDDLYLSLIREGFAELVAGLGPLEEEGSAWAELRKIVEQLVDFGVRHPHFIELMRGGSPAANDRGMESKGWELVTHIEGVVRRGVASGEMADPDPLFTAILIPSLVRGAMLYRPTGHSPAAVTDHVFRLLRRGLSAGEGA